MRDTFALAESSLAGTSLRRSIMRYQGVKRNPKGQWSLSNVVNCDLKRSLTQVNVTFWPITNAMSILKKENVKHIGHRKGRKEKNEKLQREPRGRLRRPKRPMRKPPRKLS